eukprot:EG_transcript_40334
MAAWPLSPLFTAALALLVGWSVDVFQPGGWTSFRSTSRHGFYRCPVSPASPARSVARLRDFPVFNSRGSASSWSHICPYEARHCRHLCERCCRQGPRLAVMDAFGPPECFRMFLISAQMQNQSSALYSMKSQK